MRETLHEWLSGLGLTESQETLFYLAGLISGVLLLALLANWLAKRLIARAVAKVAARTATTWDDALVRHKVFSRLAHFAPALVVWAFAPLLSEGNQTLAGLLRRGCEAYMLLLLLLVTLACLKAIEEVYRQYKISDRIPIKGYLQVAKILLAIGGAIFILSITMDKSPWIFLSGMGALGAILLLIFKDTILGLVAGIQLVTNDMVRNGDWIQMPKYGADGDVIEVALTTLKVRNWDKTITTVPTYAMISDSFKNWRGMSESGGRRIKRALLIDVNSIRFCSPEMIEQFSRISLLQNYIASKSAELAKYNAEHRIDDSVLVNGRRMTNLGTFRAYLIAYLRQHPKIHQELTFLIRQLDPTENGLPLEVYVFSNDQNWVNYEGIQADIFDHLFGCLPEFGLRAFQRPSGLDLREGLSSSSIGAHKH